MFKNYFVVAWRNITRKKLYSFINAFGLSIGFAFCLLMYLYIVDERTFDRFHERLDRLFMLTERGFDQDKYEKGEPSPYRQSAYLPAKFAEVLREEVNGVEHVSRFNDGEGAMSVGDKVFKQSVTYVDSGFFKMFSFKLRKGNPNNIFKSVNEAVLTEPVAKKFFGDEDPIGKTFDFDAEGVRSFIVSAIIESPPGNSSLNFEVLLPIEARPFFGHNRESWGAFGYPTFVQLKANVDTGSFRRDFNALVEKYVGDRFKRRRERQNIPSQFSAGNFGYVKLENVHLNSDVSWSRVSDPKYSLILGGIAVLILVIACINYVSLSLTTSAARRVEVGIRKVVGARKDQLRWQFTLESVTIALIAACVSIGLLFLALPAFNSFTGKSLEVSQGSFLTITGLALLMALLIGAVAGSYPSFVLSRFLPASVLKGHNSSKLQAGLTKPLVVVQFVMSGFLIISSVVMFRQMRFVATKDLGYNKDQVLAIPTYASYNADADRMVDRFRQETNYISQVMKVAGTSSSFNQGWSRYGYQIKGEPKSAFVYRVDPDYVEALGIEFVEGRNFNPQLASDSTAIIVNEALVKDMNWKHPLEEHLNWTEDSTSLGARVIGVVRDYHFLSLEQEIEPLFLTINTNAGYLTTIMVKIGPQEIPATIQKLKSVWNTINPQKPFDYTFVDDDVARQYESYDRWMKITCLSTSMAIIIATLGLFGLAGINAVNRTKEIGIRKVMGAGESSIFVLMNKQYVLLSILAFAIAAPFSYYTMNKWLGGFKYHVEMSWEIFAISALAGLTVALLAVSYHTFKAVRINPAETLKHNE